MYMKFVYFAFIFLLFSSCLDFKKANYKESINSLAINLSSLQEKRVEFIDSINFYINNSIVIDSIFKSTYKDDTLSLYNAENIDLFLNYKRAFTQLYMETLSLDSIIVLKRESIENLDKDIQKSSGIIAKYDYFISFEKDQISRISNVLKESELKFIELKIKYEDLLPKLNSYFLSL